MKILVTGACGFIGSHLVESLVTKGHNVKAFTFYNSRNSNGWIDNLDKNVKKQIQVVSGDIRDYHFLEKQSKKLNENKNEFEEKIICSKSKKY